MSDMMQIPYQKILLLTMMIFFLLPVNTPLAAERQKTILAFGDSLIAGYGIALEKSFPAQLEQKLAEAGLNVRVVNAGVSGDTTSGGLTRLEWVLDQNKPDFVIVELGANDMLRGLDPKVTRGNLQKIMEILKTKKTPALLAGMRSFRNLGSLFSDAYQDMYEDLAKEYDAVYFPFFLEGVVLEQSLLLDDGLHPNEQGVAKIVENILPSVKELLERE